MNQVATDDEDDDESEEGESVHYVSLNAIETAKGQRAMATFSTLETGHSITFQLDTGSTRNILPFKDYVAVTNDPTGEKLLPTKVVLVIHNKAKEMPRGAASLIIKRNNKAYRLRFIVVPDDVTPLLSLEACQDMDLIEIKNSNDILAVNDVEEKDKSTSKSKNTVKQEKMARDAVL